MVKALGKPRSPGLRALEASGDGYWELNLLDGSAWFSDWFFTQLQWTSEMRVSTWSALRDCLSPASWELSLQRMRDHLETRAAFDIEVEVENGAGETCWWRLRGAAERHASGQPRYLSGSATDISEERASRTRLERNLAWLASGFEALPKAAALIDNDGVIVHANERWQHAGAEQSLAGLGLGIGQNYLGAWTAGGRAGSPIAQGIAAILRGAQPEFTHALELTTPARTRHLGVHARAFDIDGSPQAVVVHEDHQP
jgi:PAS domain-containing protein